MKDETKRLNRFTKQLEKLCKHYGIYIKATTDPTDDLPIAVAYAKDGDCYDYRVVQNNSMSVHFGDKIKLY